MGSGANFVEAEADLIREAAELAEVLASLDPVDLDEDAIALREFVVPFLGASFSEVPFAA